MRKMVFWAVSLSFLLIVIISANIPSSGSDSIQSALQLMTHGSGG
ncbi:hypothetical protein [Bacillus sp. FJAT-27264]|nr:hypothetical protein [Bacillus sp. FJAT-27264]